MLTRLGQQVDLVEDGSQAITAVGQAAYDLVLMDVQMPEMDGYEATRRIRALDGKPGAVPIVALTANATPGDEVLSRQAGMNGHLSKPLTYKRLREVLTNWPAAHNGPVPLAA